ncbi:MAG TPA: c-type cytochrome [Bryobacteraceae bacterium]|jgi:cytochrome c oxidase cbb3-type subunit 3|nr:c-type cytochrome [Bryobacteraceae bacterium]
MITRCLNARQTFSILNTCLLFAGFLSAQAPSRDPAPNPSQSPAARPRPKPASTEAWPAAEVKTGETRFVSQCGFCHGRDATGDQSGLDLTRSQLVADDIRGEKIGPLVRAGRPDAGMPPFRIKDAELQAIVAFIHTQAKKFSEFGGGRRSVDPADLDTGNAADGRAYFNGPGGCSKCHSATGDLAGLASRYHGLILLERMLYPSGQPAPALPKATLTLPSGQTIVAPIAAEDEFSVIVLDPTGTRRTFSKSSVKVKSDDPMDAHFAQLGKYTDADMHNVYAYLATLK